MIRAPVRRRLTDGRHKHHIMKAFNLESNAALVLFSGGSRLSRQIIAPGGDNAETSYADVHGEQVTSIDNTA